MTQTYIDPQGAPQPDRRNHSHLRVIFEDFQRTISPFLSSPGHWGSGNLSYLARRQIQESFPHLSNNEIDILIQAVTRLKNNCNVEVL
jgi:hypothetical protein